MANMEFWGVDVKAKQPCKVSLEEGHVIHLSQATLSELKKDMEPVTIHVKVGEKKLVLGLLSHSTPQLMFDLIFETDFEISHNWKNGSIHLLGYKSEMNDEEDDVFSSSDDEEDVPLLQGENGNLYGTVPVAAAAKPKVDAKPAKNDKPKPEETDDSDEDDSDDDDDSEDGDDSDEEMAGKTDESDEDDDDDDDEDDSDSEDEKPVKLPSGKKRANADAKTPESKKAKLVTPQKTDGKKAVHTATPHPSKKGKSPGGDKSTPKSGGQLSCTPCKKTFNSDGALQSHNQAKHSAAK